MKVVCPHCGEPLIRHGPTPKHLTCPACERRIDHYYPQGA
jgi:uncharacterized Zn finger protein (UPF0148 family)